MTQNRRDDDSKLIDRAAENATPSQQSSAGGNLAREVGQRDELKSLEGDLQPTGVDKRDQPEDGDLPSPRQTRL